LVYIVAEVESRRAESFSLGCGFLYNHWGFIHTTLPGNKQFYSKLSQKYKNSSADETSNEFLAKS
jgi:hypothetical protein